MNQISDWRIYQFSVAVRAVLVLPSRRNVSSSQDSSAALCLVNKSMLHFSLGEETLSAHKY